MAKSPAPKPARTAQKAPQSAPAPVRSRAAQVTTGLRSPANTERFNLNQGQGSTLPPNSVEAAVLPSLNRSHLQEPTPHAQRNSWVFRSKGLNHRVLLWNEPDTPLGGGRYKPGKTAYAAFKMGEYRTKDAQVAARLLENPNCGLHGDYWDGEEEDHALAQQQLSGAISAFKANPGLLREFLEQVQAGSFDDILQQDEEEGQQIEPEVPAGDEGEVEVDNDGDGDVDETVSLEQARLEGALPGLKDSGN